MTAWIALESPRFLATKNIVTKMAENGDVRFVDIATATFDWSPGVIYAIDEDDYCPEWPWDENERLDRFWGRVQWVPKISPLLDAGVRLVTRGSYITNLVTGDPRYEHVNEELLTLERLIRRPDITLVPHTGKQQNTPLIKWAEKHLLEFNIQLIQVPEDTTTATKIITDRIHSLVGG